MGSRQPTQVGPSSREAAPASPETGLSVPPFLSRVSARVPCARRSWLFHPPDDGYDDRRSAHEGAAAGALHEELVRGHAAVTRARMACRASCLQSWRDPSTRCATQGCSSRRITGGLTVPLSSVSHERTMRITVVLRWLILPILGVVTVTARCLRQAGRLREARESARPPVVRGSRRTGLHSALILYGEGGHGLAHAFVARGIRPVFRSADQLAVDICGSVARVHEQVAQRDLADVALVHIRDHRLPPGLCSTISRYLSAHPRTFVKGDNLEGARSGLAAPSMIHQCVELALSGENVPDREHLPAPRLSPSFDMLAARCGTPFVLKLGYAYGGEVTRLAKRAWN